MSFIGDQLKALTGQLFPTGRAFWIPTGSDKEKLTEALLASEERFYGDAISTFDSVLPDNDNFTTDDATAWEKRLGLVSNPLVSIVDRKLAILRKINHPGTIKARQHYLYLQGQLQAAGFNVYVYENRFPSGYGYISITPTDFSSSQPFPHAGNDYGLGLLYGQGYVYGGKNYTNKIANSIYQSGDDLFQIGSTYNFSFFIGGPTPGSWATVDYNRETEFRQLVLKIKPVHTVAFLLLNFY
jgi:hypothetical protein